MATDDYFLDQVERSQQHQTARRRSARSRRRRIYLLVGFVSLALLILGLPSLISHSPIGRSIVARTVADYGLNGQAASARIGWITPLRITGLKVSGDAGSEITIEQLDSGVTISKLIRGIEDYGDVVIRGLNVRCSVAKGRCNLEDDLSELLSSSGESSNASGSVRIQDATIDVTDATNGKTWRLAQANADVQFDAQQTHGKFAGVVNEPAGGGGSLQGTVTFADATATTAPWQIDLESQSIPLSVVSLLLTRFPDATSIVPSQIAGDATGAIRLVGTANGDIESSVYALEVRNLVASHANPQNPRVWANALASVQGDLIIQSDRVIGRRLKATTDFAAATLDGAFSTSLTLVGADDNPLQWLDALDGSASIEIDLASFDEALPGLLPLRDEAKIVSGRAAASVRSLPHNGVHRSELSIRSEAVRARAHGRAVVIEPIELDATVANRDGTVRAEQFKLASSFASAIGQGSMQAGQADFQIDFGRLSAMLRPLVDMSKTTLGGSASGNIRWNASNQNVWRLTGNGNATNLLVSLPDGRELKRPTLRADVEAVGRWGGQALQELSTAKLTILSNGLDLKAELTRPVPNPTTKRPIPLQIRGTGRIETVAETLGPWLPAQLHDAEGGFKLNANVDASSMAGQLTRATIELTSPRVAYAERWFAQAGLKIEFDGRYAWPSGDFQSNSLTLAGDAVSLAVEGKATADTVDLEMAWLAKLERIQGSVTRVAARQGSPYRQASFRPGTATSSDDWVVMGDCQGKLTITSHDHILDIQSDTTGKNIAIVQPPSASAQLNTVGPMPRRATAPGRSVSNAQSLSRVVWSEPNLKLAGLTHYNLKNGEVIADGMQLSSDWLATTLTGKVAWTEAIGEISLDGPARLRMEEVSRRLTSLLGTEIRVTGIHETPLEIRARRDADDAIAFSVTGNVGWEMGEVGGVAFGAAAVPVRLTDTAVHIQPVAIPVGQGQLNLAGDVFYRPGPVWLQAAPGVGARNIRMTTQMTNRWLKYLAPLASQATQIDGTMSAEIDEAIVVIDNPEQSRVRGRLIIDGAQMNTGPLANQIISGIEQLKAIARLNANALVATNQAIDSRTLITMPAQTVEFALQRGIVQHERLFFNVDRAQIITGGRVGLDGQLQLVAQVPLDARWLGSELQNLAGQPVALPINGTLSQPRLDSSGVREVVTQLGVQAAQSTAENYLQKQLNKSIDKIFGR